MTSSAAGVPARWAVCGREIVAIGEFLWCAMVAGYQVPRREGRGHYVGQRCAQPELQFSV
jgi:hypothetical protein